MGGGQHFIPSQISDINHVTSSYWRLPLMAFDFHQLKILWLEWKPKRQTFSAFQLKSCGCLLLCVLFLFQSPDLEAHPCFKLDCLLLFFYCSTFTFYNRLQSIYVCHLFLTFLHFLHLQLPVLAAPPPLQTSSDWLSYLVNCPVSSSAFRVVTDHFNAQKHRWDGGDLVNTWRGGAYFIFLELGSYWPRINQ